MAFDLSTDFEHRVTEAERTALRLVDQLRTLRSGEDAARNERLPRLARDLYRQRRVRDRFFDRGLFGEPAWDLLLDLYIARIESRAVSTSSACLGAGVPATTALRWIKQLEQEGFVRRGRPEDDQRVKLVALSDEGFLKMTALLSHLIGESRSV